MIYDTRLGMSPNYTPKPRRTEADWDAVSAENPIATALRVAARQAENVLRGTQAVAYLCGGAGLGKSYTIERATNAAGVEPIRFTSDNYRDLIFAFDQSRGVIPLVFEECDHLLRSKRSINLLKQATDIAGPRELQVRVPPRARGEEAELRAIPLTAPILIAANGNMLDDKQWPADCRPHLEALRDREQPLMIDGPPGAKWEYAVYLAYRHGMLRRTENGQHDVPLCVQNAAIRWFSEHLWQLANPSPRTLRKIAAKFMVDHRAKVRAERTDAPYDPRALDEDLSQFLAGDPTGQPIPYYPQIVVPLRPTKKERKTAAAAPGAHVLAAV